MSTDSTASSIGKTTSEYSRADARIFFLKAIERHAQHVVEALREQTPEKWAQSWFGGARWALQQGKATKSAWDFSPLTAERFEFGRYPKGLSKGLGVPLRERFEYSPWNPLKESESAARKRLREQFQGHLDEKIEEQKTRGAVPDIQAVRSLERNCEWLVLYQYHHKTIAEIAARLDEERSTEKVSPDAIRKAVMRLAKLIELDLHEGDPPGRPKKRR